MTKDKKEIDKTIKEKDKDKKTFKDSKFYKEYLPYIIIIIVVIFFKMFICSPVRVNGSSMYPTLLDKDIMILNKLSCRFNDFNRFDIVVVDGKEEYLIKRVIGLSGEEIEYKNNKLYVNGKYVKEDFEHGETEHFKVKVPKGKYFVMGDNRENSLDSRYFGSFKRKDILGTTKLIVLPFSRFGNKN